MAADVTLSKPPDGFPSVSETFLINVNNEENLNFHDMVVVVKILSGSQTWRMKKCRRDCFERGTPAAQLML